MTCKAYITASVSFILYQDFFFTVIWEMMLKFLFTCKTNLQGVNARSSRPHYAQLSIKKKMFLSFLSEIISAFGG